MCAKFRSSHGDIKINFKNPTRNYGVWGTPAQFSV